MPPPTGRTIGRTPGALLATTLAVTGLALLPSTTSAVSAPGAADATPGYSVRALTVDVLVGPRGDERCTIDADLYLPDGAGPRRKVPAILTTHGFGGTKDDANQTAVGRGFARAGYAVLSYSGLGFGATTCKITLDDPRWDGKAGRQLVDVLAGTRVYTAADGTQRRLRLVSQERRGDPRVGMIGGSYGGQNQYAVASRDRRVDALVPIITWNDLNYSLAPGRVAKKQWVDLFFGAGILSGAQGATADPETLTGCPSFTDQTCTGVVAMNTVGYADPGTERLARAASVASYVRQVKAPTLVVQGQKDTLFNLNEAVATYRALQRQGTETKLVFQSWGHSGGDGPVPGELDFGSGSLRDSYLGARFLSWMERHVRGRRVATGPEFSYFRDWVRYDTRPARAKAGVARAYATAPRLRWEPTRTLHLSGDGSLRTTRSRVLAGQQRYGNLGPAPTSYSETSGLEGDQVNNPPSDAPGTATFFTTPRLREAAQLVGSPRVRLRLHAPTAALSQRVGASGQLVLFAKLYAVAPNGTKTLQHRLVSPLRVADVTRPVTLRLPGVVQRIPAGHRIQLAVAASDAAYAGNPVPHPVAIRTSPGDPSTLALPVLGALKL